ncbi:3-hydroxy-3-isohexenylglutaryl-CoA/hydroxy-methylglutaryl-CoA lyase [bacterium HR26]|nr:3-hydroxy-3-isohexenylglutaryl-CoA/hydroxy-methylglutaryl-CoA lyase [bacterium HR26]
MAFVERLPRQVVVVEVGPRDGLQNEAQPVPTELKVAFIERLAEAGLPVIEVTSFVSPKAVPQLADAEEVMRRIARRPGTRYLALVPNERGLDRALAAGCDAIALFTAASEAFSQVNVHASIEETFQRFRPVAERARAAGLWIRGYVSTAFHCPYSGPVDPRQALSVTERLFALGCHEVALADTIGRATPRDVDRLLALATRAFEPSRLALHFHDTAGLALANVMIGLDYGITVFDASAGGLGGCPFAPGAPGNLATERLLALLEGLGIETGVDREAVAAAVAELHQAVPGIGAHAC